MSPAGQHVQLRRHEERIVVLSFSHQPSGTMGERTEVELAAALDAIQADDAVRVVILTGADPGVFIRHYDVGVLEARSRALLARGLRFTLERPVPETLFHRCLARIEADRRIYIAAINGVAMGGGYELALACDLRIAQTGDYRIGLPESNIGLLPGAGGTQRLSRLIGTGRALEFILLGRTFAPREAAQAGLVNECCEGSALHRAQALAGDLADKSRRALGHIKHLVRHASEGDPAAGLAAERTLFCDLMVDTDSIERMAQMNTGRRRIEGDPAQ